MTKPRPPRAELVHIGEQLIAVLSDFSPMLAPLVARQVQAYQAEGFSREEAVELGGQLQHTVIATLMRLGRKKPPHL